MVISTLITTVFLFFFLCVLSHEKECVHYVGVSDLRSLD